jgi:hypothetical protein
MKVGYSRLLLNDWVLPEQNAPLFSSLLDINMLALFASMERTTTQFKEILESEGFEFVQLHGLLGAEGVIEAIPKADPVDIGPALKLEEVVGQTVAAKEQPDVAAEVVALAAVEKHQTVVAVEELPVADSAIVERLAEVAASPTVQPTPAAEPVTLTDAPGHSAIDAVETQSASSVEIEVQQVSLTPKLFVVSELPQKRKHDIVVAVSPVDDAEPVTITSVQ